jgi:hypothetical protein
MRKYLIAACCATLLGVPVASAQTQGPPGQSSMSTGSGDAMNANAKMKKKKMTKDDGMTKGEGMQKGSDMTKGGDMSKGGTK